MQFTVESSIEILSRTPVVLKTLVEGLSNDWLTTAEGENTWNTYDIIGHLIFGEETDWIPRATIILTEGETRQFEPFDRFAQFTKYKGMAISDLLKSFSEWREKNIQILKSWNLTDEQLNLKGKHPELGTVTLRQLLATWVVHDLDHLNQISRIMAKRYSNDVGVWKEYLSILREREKT